MRSILESVPVQKVTEGGGVQVRRAFPTHRIAHVDPFLLFDHLGPLAFSPGEARGFPEHPHRGFETVTYLLRGAMEHRDSFGNHGRLGPGDVQWMTAGSGLVHAEMPAAEMVRDGGVLEGFQIWVNLPRRDKMTAPHYQEWKAERIPRVIREGVEARVVAGEAMGVRGAVETRSPIAYIHFTLAPGATFQQAAPASQNALVYSVEEGRMTAYAHDGDAVELANAGDVPVNLLFLAGQPLDEPVVRYGPFVMNSKEEIAQAFEDFRSGKMGTLA